jgi:hypothetical protein
MELCSRQRAERSEKTGVWVLDFVYFFFFRRAITTPPKIRAKLVKEIWGRILKEARGRKTDNAHNVAVH